MKKTFRIKKICVVIALLAVLSTVIFAGCSSPKMKVNIPDVENAVDFDIAQMAYENLKIIGQEHSNRTMATEGELEAAIYISNFMRAYGYESSYSFTIEATEGESKEVQGLQGFKTSFKRLSGEELTDAQAYNVIFTKKSAAEKSKGEIVLACQYDNLYAEKTDGKLWKVDGSYESGAAIAVMLTLAEALADVDLDYDLTFAFFTGGCYEWKGAMNYVDTLDRDRLDKIALVLNFAMLGGGDNWYIYSGEKSNTYGKYLNKCAEGYVKAVPKDRNPGQFYLTEDTIFSYTNVGMLSNHYYFNLKDVPTANVLSINWEINNNPLFSEMKGKANVYHTQNDTLKKMIERKGENGIKTQLLDVVRSTLVALDKSNQDTLKSSLDLAKSEMPNKAAQNSKTSTLTNILLKVILIAILIAVSYVIKHTLYKNIDKYVEARKAKEAQSGESQESQEPFGETPSSGEGNAQGAEKSKENAVNKPDEDPFV